MKNEGQDGLLELLNEISEPENCPFCASQGIIPYYPPEAVIQPIVDLPSENIPVQPPTEEFFTPAPTGDIVIPDNLPIIDDIDNSIQPPTGEIVTPPPAIIESDEASEESLTEEIT